MKVVFHSKTQLYYRKIEESSHKHEVIIIDTLKIQLHPHKNRQNSSQGSDSDNQLQVFTMSVFFVMHFFIKFHVEKPIYYYYLSVSPIHYRLRKAIFFLSLD